MVKVITAEAFVADNYDWDAGPGFDGTDPHRIPVPAAAETAAGGSAPPRALLACVLSSR
jgi:hypothetical protein